MAIGQEETGRRIRIAREAADLTQRELAERIGLQNAQSISRYERGVTEVSVKRLHRIAEATRKPMTFFAQEPAELQARQELDATVVDRLDRIERTLAALVARFAQDDEETP